MSTETKGFIQTPNGYIAVSRIVRFVRIDSPGWHDNGQVRVWLEGGAPEGFNTGMWESDFLKALDEATPDA